MWEPCSQELQHGLITGSIIFIFTCDARINDMILSVNIAARRSDKSNRWKTRKHFVYQFQVIAIDQVIAEQYLHQRPTAKIQAAVPIAG